jgi:uncharacterized membrane protein
MGTVETARTRGGVDHDPVGARRRPDDWAGSRTVWSVAAEDSHHHHVCGGPVGSGVRPWWVWAVLVAVVVAVGAAMAALWPSDQSAARVGHETYPAVVQDRVEYPCWPGSDQLCVEVQALVGDEVIRLGEVGADTVLGRAGTGTSIVVGYEPSTGSWFFLDQDRRGRMAVLVVGFSMLVWLVGRGRGLRALAGLAVSCAVLVGFCAPAVLAGEDPVVVCLVAAAAICAASTLLTHGVRSTSVVVIGSMYASLAATWVLGLVVFPWLGLSGALDEEARLVLGTGVDVDLAGLLLGGAVLGALGALDDVVVTQVAAVVELGPGRSRAETVRSALRIGRHHIAAGVNTLLLAYAGAAMPLLLLFSLGGQGWGVAANSELVATEIARTLVGSVGLLLAIPLSTSLAAALVRGSAPAHGPGAGESGGDVGDTTQ